MRKESIAGFGAAAVLFGTSIFPSGCSNESQHQSSPTRPAISGIITPESLLGQWKNKTPLERINAFELRQHPTSVEFDFNKEFALATAQFYCQQVKCKKTPEEMANSVSVVSREEFVQKIQEAGTGQIPDPHSVGVTINDKTFINETRIKEIVERNKQSLPDTLRGKDMATFIKKGTYFHEYTHLNSLDKDLRFDRFSLDFKGDNSSMAFDQMRGFRILGRDSNDQIRFIEGTNEGLTELTANIVSSRTNLERTYAPTPDYEDLTILLMRLHTSANISLDDVLKYVSEEKPIEEYLRRIGKLKRNPQIDDLRAGVLALIFISLRLDAGRSLDDVNKMLNENFKLN